LGRLHLGTSGWSYREWVGVFYPTEDTNKLSYYSQVFTTAEIDSTFYAYPNRGLVWGWVRNTPPGFTFAAKLPKLITHKKELDPARGVKEDLDRFLELMKPLEERGKLGPLLVQLPPGFKRGYQRLEAFLKLLPEDLMFAIEFRHPSWWREETWELLKRYRVANTVVDEPLLPPDPVVTAEFSFIRWHGHGKRPWYNYCYSEEELERWVPRLREVLDRVEEVYGYFNNHFHGYAVKNALQLLKMLGTITPEQEAVLTRTSRLTGPPSTTGREEGEGGLEFEKLLARLVPARKLARARAIGEDEVEVALKGEGRVTARVREYRVLIDAGERTILHDCADWARCIPERTLCKHLAKVLLTLDHKTADKLLQDLVSKRKEWRFDIIKE
jgi:uncharacterized protein YecE (DUF72 family)